VRRPPPGYDAAMTEQLVVIIAPPDVTLLDVTGPWEVFCRAALYAPGRYRVVVASTDEQPAVRTKFGLDITCHCPLADVDSAADTVLVAGSEHGVAGNIDPRFLEWLRRRHATSRRIGSVCTGAFYLAHAGLLNGRRATTHWRYLDALANQFKEVRVEPEPIFVRDGTVYTSAGITAGIDLALALVEEDCGTRIAQAVARDLVVFLQRQAGQPQLSASLAQRTADREPLRDLQRWLPDHLDEISSVADMAAAAHMSPRNFSRLFKREVGVTPAEYLRMLRAEAAQRRLQQGSGKKQQVAAQVGFGSSRSMQRLLSKQSRRIHARRK
jgi:transcriptional regulator GlxA family with amidase domain